MAILTQHFNCRFNINLSRLKLSGLNSLEMLHTTSISLGSNQRKIKVLSVLIIAQLVISNVLV